MELEQPSRLRASRTANDTVGLRNNILNNFTILKMVFSADPDVISPNRKGHKVHKVCTRPKIVHWNHHKIFLKVNALHNKRNQYSICSDSQDYC